MMLCICIVYVYSIVINLSNLGKLGIESVPLGDVLGGGAN
jgi:hypothetical protein